MVSSVLALSTLSLIFFISKNKPTINIPNSVDRKILFTTNNFETKLLLKDNVSKLDVYEVNVPVPAQQLPKGIANGLWELKLINNGCQTIELRYLPVEGGGNSSDFVKVNLRYSKTIQEYVIGTAFINQKINPDKSGNLKLRFVCKNSSFIEMKSISYIAPNFIDTFLKK